MYLASEVIKVVTREFSIQNVENNNVVLYRHMRARTICNNSINKNSYFVCELTSNIKNILIKQNN